MRDKVDALREEQAALKDTIRDLTAERDALRREVVELKAKN
jgi:FtsZ-binding cell division protein ZapB